WAWNTATIFVREFPKNLEPAAISVHHNFFGDIGCVINGTVSNVMLSHENIGWNEGDGPIFPELNIRYQKPAHRHIQAFHETAADQVAMIADTGGDLPVRVQ